MKTSQRIFVFLIVLIPAVLANAQSDRDLEQTCRTEVARRLNMNRDRVDANMSGWTNGRAQVQWRGNNRNGYCQINRQMRIVDFRDLGMGNPRDDRDDDRDYRDSRWHSISDYPRVAVDTDGRGPFNLENQSYRIRRGYVNTRETPSVAFNCDGNFRVTFRGEIGQANSDREFVMRITSSDRGDARGMATFRLNPDKNEVEFISVRGRLNGRRFDGTFDRNR
ncbi:MAG TPA: hypothetical protein VLK33_01005 [Terriglobales bacterium]|nr:hypothetical protein [Terriglobales bacterium]